MLSIPTKYLRLIMDACLEAASSRRQEGNMQDAVALAESSAMLATMFRDDVTHYHLTAVEPKKADEATS